MRGKLTREREGLYYGYYGFDDLFFYAWMWCDLSYEHDIHIRNVSVVDELGCAVLDVGEVGFTASSSELLNSLAVFVAPKFGEDFTIYQNHDYADAQDAGLDNTSMQGHSSTEHDSWLLSLSGDDSSLGIGSSCASTCATSGGASCGSSCGSSCASSCGGCAGGCGGFG